MPTPAAPFVASASPAGDQSFGLVREALLGTPAFDPNAWALVLGSVDRRLVSALPALRVLMHTGETLLSLPRESLAFALSLGWLSLDWLVAIRNALALDAKLVALVSADDAVFGNELAEQAGFSRRSQRSLRSDVMALELLR